MIEHLYKILIHVTEKGLEYTVVEFDVKSETTDNYIIHDDVFHNRTKRIAKSSLLNPTAYDSHPHVMGRIWVKAEDIKEGREAVRVAVEKKCDFMMNYGKMLQETYAQRKLDMSKVHRDVSRRYDG